MGLSAIYYCSSFLYSGIYKLRTRQLKLRNLALEKTVAERTQEVIEKQKHIQESINYAFFIQKSTLPQDSDMANAFASHLLSGNPKQLWEVIFLLAA